jgi:hypothetical protein
MKIQVNLIRRIFLIIFIFTFLCSLLAQTIIVGGPASYIDAATIALFTSIISFLGFMVTTVISLRKEKRETKDAELSQKQKEIEIEKARLELELLKKQVEKKKK